MDVSVYGYESLDSIIIKSTNPNNLLAGQKKPGVVFKSLSGAPVHPGESVCGVTAG